MSTDSADRSPRARETAYVRFGAPDLDAMEAFQRDFGFTRCERRDDALLAWGSARPYPLHITEQGEASFAGFAFGMARDELDRLAVRERITPKTRQNALAGAVLTLSDPDGFTVEAYASALQGGEASQTPVDRNEGEVYARRNRRLEIEGGPSTVRRLGHVVLNVSDFEASRRWYEEHFGLIVSDFIHLGNPEQPVGAFMRCNIADEPTDHHSLFLIQGEKARFEHAAFEVVDFDDLMAGHDHLLRAGTQHSWGVGRHILGNHIFDYWRDPFGNELEHWTDGDILDAEHPPGSHGLDVLLGTQWGKPHPMLAGEQHQDEAPQ